MKHNQMSNLIREFVFQSTPIYNFPLTYLMKFAHGMTKTNWDFKLRDTNIQTGRLLKCGLCI